MMSSVFAPYCAQCDRRVLLGCDDIVGFISDGTARHVVMLRCSCGTLVEWNRQPPGPGPRRAHDGPAPRPPARRPEPAAADR